MPFTDQERASNDALQQTLSALNEIPPAGLARTEELGRALSFEAGVPIFERALGLFRELSGVNLEGVSAEAMHQMHTAANEALALFKQIQDFKIEENSENVTARRDSLIDNVRVSFNNWYAAITQHLSYARLKTMQPAAVLQEATEALVAVRQIEATAKSELDTKLEEAQTTLSAMRDAAAKEGVSKHGEHFREAAASFSKDAARWMARAVVCATLLVITVVILFAMLHEKGDAKTPQLVSLALLKTFIAGAAFYAMVFCARQYGASKHNEVVNTHRLNALNTFETFVQGTSDPAVRDAILLQAAQSIFVSQPTGYLKDEPDIQQQVTSTIPFIQQNLTKPPGT